jgi:CDP-glycerol glycerophosphotransferase
VLVTRASGSTVLSRDVELSASGGPHTFTVALPMADLRAAAADEPGGEGQWTLRIALPGAAKSVPLRAAAGLSALRDPARDADGLDVGLGRTPTGRTRLTCIPPRPVVDHAQWDGKVLELAGRWPVEGMEIALVTREAARDQVLTPVVSGDRFTVAFEPGAMVSLAGTLPIAQGDWLAVVRPSDDRADAHPLLAEDTVLATLPIRHDVGSKAIELTEDGGNIELLVGPALRDDERGVSNQRRLQTVEFPKYLASGLRDEVLIESYESRAYGDNARAVLEELARRETGLRCRWVVVDGQTELPPGVEAVNRASREYYEALARSKYVLVPNYRPLSSWLETPKDQILVQTWHGAPYKQIALDNQRGQAFGSRQYVDMLKRESARWDYLLSPNPPSTPILRKAFAYDGEMLETGYPRTDVFYSPDREARAAAVREKLQLPEGKKVVLYAPTMRDDHNYGGSRYSLDLRIDLRKARAELGDDHVLLVRRHAKVVDTVLAADGDFARDVSLWPDVNELLLATDVLVTDYSSLMFDFANTRRPMLFFTYDLEDYAGRLRGLYFDPARMPGPHLPTSDALVEAIRDVDALHEAHADKYRAFTDDFCAWDDGGAAARFVDRVFGSASG